MITVLGEDEVIGNGGECLYLELSFDLVFHSAGSIGGGGGP